jgi:hypothetical protein
MPRPKKAKMNKSDFVRSMGKTPAKEVVAAAAKQGMKLTDRYVYVIRSADKAKGRVGGSAGRGRGAKATGSGAETELRRAIAELGLGRARQVLREVEAAFGGR